MEFAVKFLSLQKPELEYEVSIRGGTPGSTVHELRKQISKLGPLFPSDDILESNFSVSADLKGVSDVLTKVQTNLDASPDRNVLLRTQNLLNHLYHRLNRIVCDDTTQPMYDVCVREFQGLTARFNAVKDIPAATILPTSNVEGATSSAPVSVNVTCDRGSYNELCKIKFDGKSCVRSFVQRITEFCEARSISDAKLLSYATEIFVGHALHWYRNVKDQVSSWVELANLLKQDFSQSDYDYRLGSEIRARTQGESENITVYLAIMSGLFLRLSKPMSEDEKLEILLHNIRPCYASTLASASAIPDISTLRVQCRNYETIQARLADFREPPRQTADTLAPEFAYAVSSEPAEDDQPFLKVNTKRNFFNIGERKAIFCEGQHLSGQMEWYSPAGEKIPRKSSKTTKMRMHVEPRPVPEQGPAFIPLVFNNLTLEDAGLYTCKAGDLNASINIIVGEKVVIQEKEQNHDAEERQSVELSCIAKGTPTPEIHWYKENNVEPIVTDGKYRITYKSKASTSTLKINDLNHMDPGTYRCRATQEAISHFAEKIYRLRVQHKPVITNSYAEREVYAILGEWKSITCKAVAFPAPKFIWSKHVGNFDEEPASDEREYQITPPSSTETGTISVLTLHITNDTLDMQYKCTVENTKGRQNFMFHVSLGNKPDRPSAVTMVSATANNITFEVSCENCTFFKEDGLAPLPENLPVLGYVFEWVPHVEEIAGPYWPNGTTQQFDISEDNGTTFTIENLDKATKYHVRVATRNLAGLSNWYDVPGSPQTTDGASVLAKSFGLLIFALIVSLTY